MMQKLWLRKLCAIISMFLVTCFHLETIKAADSGGDTSAPANPHRIVCLSPYPAEILCDMGEADKIIAISKSLRDGAYDKFLKDKPVVGGSYGRLTNVELVLGLNPDLVFCTIGHVDILKSRGLNVYGTGTYDIEGIMGLIRDIGKLTGKEETAEKMVETMKIRIQKVEEKIKFATNKPLVYFEQSSLGQSRAKGSLTHELITRAGGINIAENESVPFPVLSQEFIISKIPISS